MKRILAALVLLSTLALSGCPWATQPDSSGVQAAKLAVQYGTLRYIGQQPEAERVAKAEKVRKIVTEVEALAKGEAVTLTLLEEAIRKQLPANMRPEDVFAVNALLGIVMTELRARVGDGLLSEEQLLTVSTVASWVVEATKFYVV